MEVAVISTKSINARCALRSQSVTSDAEPAPDKEHAEHRLSAGWHLLPVRAGTRALDVASCLVPWAFRATGLTEDRHCSATSSAVYYPNAVETVGDNVTDLAKALDFFKLSSPPFIQHLQSNPGSNWKQACRDFCRPAYAILEDQAPEEVKWLVTLGFQREDVIQDILIHFIDNEASILQGYEDRGYPFSHWFWVVAKHKALQLWKKAKTERRYTSSTSSFDSGDASIDAHVEGQQQSTVDPASIDEIVTVYSHVFSQLRPECQDLLKRRLQGQKPREIAKALYPAEEDANKTVSDSLRQCVNRFAELLFQGGYEDLIPPKQQERIKKKQAKKRKQ